MAPVSIRGSLLEDFNAVSKRRPAATFRPPPRSSGVASKQTECRRGVNNLGISLLRQGKVADAKAAFGRTLALDPGYPPGLVNAGLLKMAKEGDPAGAAVLFARAAAADPDSPAARVNLAIAQARLGETGAALETLQAARRRFPRNADILYHTGTIHERTGNRERAAETYAAFLRESAGARPSLESSVRERLKAWGKVP
jgi:tetratricopeptide (TPR) repeat protein